MFLAVLLLVSLSFCRHLLFPRGPSQSQHTEDDAILHRLSAIDVGGDQIVAEAATMLANASISSSPSHDNYNHRLLYLPPPPLLQQRHIRPAAEDHAPPPRPQRQAPDR